MKIKTLCAMAMSLVIRQAMAVESELQFNPAFLNGESANSADLAWVNAGSALPPGEYNLNVYINNAYAFTGDVTFRADEQGAGDAQPCVTPQQIDALGIDPNQAKGGALPLAQRCIVLQSVFPGSHVDYDQKTLDPELYRTAEALMRNLPRGYVSPESWEPGITAAWLNYVLNGLKQ
ncbi:P pilus assembly protein, porin PapC [Enterobacter cancerogenus]|uniref:P pilus assembly protein, porin PapC n=1 Tax=Enterobacter cancerogenus TaxID=69218 RepID=A0A484WYD6_9ENTR|nr:P pilus assembly protein, porin PapC [Enterobacter cancerogenus]